MRVEVIVDVSRGVNSYLMFYHPAHTAPKKEEWDTSQRFLVRMDLPVPDGIDGTVDAHTVAALRFEKDAESEKGLKP